MVTLSERYRWIAELRDADAILHAAAVTRSRSTRDVHGPVVPPSTEGEAWLAGVWREVLGLDEVGIDDNFFELGGDSLHVTQVLARIQSRRGCELSVEHFFEGPTVREFAVWLAAAEGEAEAIGRP